MSGATDKPILRVDTVAAWEAFLEAPTDADGVRLRLRKIASSQPGITYADALDAALCFGWIDGQVGALDSDYHLQVFTPRRPRSVWSQRNRDHVERLVSEGRMRPAGQAQVDRAKVDGRWEADKYHSKCCVFIFYVKIKLRSIAMYLNMRHDLDNSIIYMVYEI